MSDRDKTGGPTSTGLADSSGQVVPTIAPATHPGGEPSSYRYAAFISYRHSELDRAWAQWLHRALETYRVPRRLAKEHALSRRIGRVFRDEEELSASADLSSSIEQALVASEFLIVICSPRTPGSRWVDQEVERFRKLGRGDRILALLIEGEPAESFPRALREIRHSTIASDGSAAGEIEEVEPLAADARPHPGRRGQVLTSRAPRLAHRPGAGGRGLLRLRLLAPILGVRFDDLRQREQERRTRRLMAVGIVMAVLTVGMGLLAIEALRERNAAMSATVEKDLQRTIAESQRAKADQKAVEAVLNLHEADKQRNSAERNLVAAETRTAESQLAHGDALGGAGHWPDAFDRYEEARERFGKLGLSTLSAEFAAWDAYRHTSPALLTMRIGTGRTYGLFSPDGVTMLITAGKRLQQRYAASGQLERNCSQHEANITAIAMSADGRIALSGGDDKTIKVWDMSGNRELHTLRDDAATSRLTISDNGAVAVSSNAANVVKVWDTIAGKMLYEVDHFEDSTHVTLTGDGKRLLIGVGGRIFLWDIAARKPIPEFNVTISSLLFCSTISPDGMLAAAGDWATRVYVWNVATGKRLGVMDGHRRGVRCVAFSPDRRYLATGSFDHTVRLWNLATFTEERVYSGHSGPLTSVAFSRDGRFLLSGSNDKTLKIWSSDAAPAVRGGFGHDDPVSSIALSPDGRLAFSGDFTRARLWDVATARQLWAEDLNTGTSAAAFTPDGRTIVTTGSVSNGSSCRLFDLLPDGSVSRRDVASDEVRGGSAVVVYPDSHFALFGGAGGRSQRVDLAQGRAVGGTFPPTKYGISNLKLSHDGKLLALTDGRLSEIRDAVNGKLLHPLGADGTSSWNAHIAWLAGSGQIFGGGSGADLHTWDAQSGKSVRALRTDAGSVSAMALSPDGTIAITSHPQQSLRLWDVQRGLLLRSMPIDAAYIRELQWAARAPIVAAAEDRVVRFFDFGHLERFRPLRERAEEAALTLSRTTQDGAAVLTLGEWYAHLGVWDRAVACFKRAGTMGERVPAVLLARCYWQDGRPDLAAVEFEKALAEAAPGGKGGAAGTRPIDDDDASNAIYLGLCAKAARREAETARGEIALVRALPGHAAPIRCMAISPDGRTALTGSMDGLVKWWDLSTGQAVRTFAAHDGVVRSVAFVPSAAEIPGATGGTVAITGGSDRAVKLWRLETVKELAAWKTDEVRTVAVSPDGLTVAAAGTDKMRLWDLRPGPMPLSDRLPRTVDGHKSTIASAAFSPDSKRLVAGTWAGIIELWDVESGAPLRSLRVHGNLLRSVVFSPDGRWILSASKDSTIRLWDVSGGAQDKSPRVFNGHQAPVTGARFSPDGKTAISISDNGTAIVWDIASGLPLRRTREGVEVSAIAAAPDGKTFYTAGYDLVLKEWDLTGHAKSAPATAPVSHPD